MKQADRFGMRLTTALALASLALLALMLLSGCYTEKKASKEVHQAHYRYPVVTAKFCSEVYPPIVSTKDSIVYKQGETVYIPGKTLTDTVTIDCDSAKKYGVSVVTKYVTQKCPDIPVRIDTFIKDRIIQVENKARVAALETQNLEYFAKLEKKKTHLNFSLIGNAILLVLLFAMGFFIYVKRRVV